MLFLGGGGKPMFKIPKTCMAMYRWRTEVRLPPPPRGTGTISWPCRVTDSAQRFRDSARSLPLPRQQIFKVPFATHEGIYFIHLGPAQRLLQGRCLVRVVRYCALHRRVSKGVKDKKHTLTFRGTFPGALPSPTFRARVRPRRGSPPGAQQRLPKHLLSSWGDPRLPSN